MEPSPLKDRAGNWAGPLAEYICRARRPMLKVPSIFLLEYKSGQARQAGACSRETMHKGSCENRRQGQMWGPRPCGRGSQPPALVDVAAYLVMVPAPEKGETCEKRSIRSKIVASSAGCCGDQGTPSYLCQGIPAWFTRVCVT